MAHILVAGCGYVGSELAVRLAREGYDVWGLKRNPKDLPNPVRPIAADLSRPETLKGLPSPLDFVFYMPSADAINDAAYRAAYVDGVKNLLLVLSGQKIGRLFYISSTRVYNATHGEWVDELTPTNPEAFAGRRLLEGEQMALSVPCPATVVRFGGIYGPGRAGLIDRIREGKAVLREGPPFYTNRIHRGDCVGILHHLMHLDMPKSLYLGVDCEPATQKEVYCWLAERLGVPPPIPGKSVPTVYESRGESNKRCRNDKIRSTGYKFLYPTYREGYGSLI